MFPIAAPLAAASRAAGLAGWGEGIYQYGNGVETGLKPGSGARCACLHRVLLECYIEPSLLWVWWRWRGLFLVPTSRGGRIRCVRRRRRARTSCRGGCRALRSALGCVVLVFGATAATSALPWVDRAGDGSCSSAQVGVRLAQRRRGRRARRCIASARAAAARAVLCCEATATQHATHQRSRRTTASESTAVARTRPASTRRPRTSARSG